MKKSSSTVLFPGVNGQNGNSMDTTGFSEGELLLQVHNRAKLTSGWRGGGVHSDTCVWKSPICITLWSISCYVWCLSVLQCLGFALFGFYFSTWSIISLFSFHFPPMEAYFKLPSPPQDHVYSQLCWSVSSGLQKTHGLLDACENRIVKVNLTSCICS